MHRLSIASNIKYLRLARSIFWGINIAKLKQTRRLFSFKTKLLKEKLEEEKINKVVLNIYFFFTKQ